MRKQFSRRRPVDRRKHDENGMTNQKRRAGELPSLTRDVITMNIVTKNTKGSEYLKRDVIVMTAGTRKAKRRDLIVDYESYETQNSSTYSICYY